MRHNIMFLSDMKITGLLYASIIDNMSRGKYHDDT
jgi:hypothetical protein